MKGTIDSDPSGRKILLNQVDKILTGKYSSWISGFIYLILSFFFGWIVQLVSGNILAGLSTALFVLALILGIMFLWQRSRLEDLNAFKAGRDFHIVCLDKIRLAPMIHPELPKGLVWLRWVKFFIESSQDNTGTIAKVVSVRPTATNDANLVDIPIRLERVSEVYLLITADYGVKSFKGALPGDGWDEKLAGHIELIFEDRSKQEFELRLGHDIRDFYFGNQPWAIDALRKEDDTSFQVWHSSKKECTLDMIVIKVKGRPKLLDKIRLVAQMEQGAKPIAYQDGKILHPPAYPAIQVFGITCRIDNRLGT